MQRHEGNEKHYFKLFAPDSMKFDTSLLSINLMQSFKSRKSICNGFMVFGIVEEK